MQIAPLSNPRKFRIAVSNTRPEWELWKIYGWFSIRHTSGMNHSGSAGYIAKLWNERFAGKGQRVNKLA